MIDQHYGQQNQADGLGLPEATPVVRVSGPNGPLETRTLQRGTLTVGSGAHNDLVLVGTGVSNNHLEISWDGAQALIYERGASHGTRLDYQKIVPFEEQAWAAGQIVQIGSYGLQLAFEQPAAPLPTAEVLSIGHLGLSVPPEARVIDLTTGEPRVFKLLLKNEGDDDEVQLSFSGVDASWLQRSSEWLSLPRGTTELPLTIIVPRTAQSKAGPYDVVARLRSRRDPAVEATASAHWVVQPFASSAARVETREERRWTATHQIVISNQGNESNSYALITDPPPLVSCEIDSDELRSSPGERATATLMARGQLRFFGRPRREQIVVEVRPLRGPAIPLKVPFEERPIFPVPAWILLPLVLLLSLGFLWIYGLLWFSIDTPGLRAAGYGIARPSTPSPTPRSDATPVPSAAPPTATPSNDQATSIAIAQATATWEQGDDDRDRLSNGDELRVYRTDPAQPDTDRDGLDDGDEIDLGTDPLRRDSDGDGLLDGDEISGGLGPLSPDTDGDGVPDARDPAPFTLPSNTPTATPLPTATFAPTPIASPSPAATTPASNDTLGSASGTPAGGSAAGGSGGGGSGGGGSGGGGSGDPGAGSATAEPPTATATNTATPTATPAPNRPPQISVPTNVTVNEEASINILGVSIVDPDAGEKKVKLSLRVLKGLLSFTTAQGTQTTSALSVEDSVANLQQGLSSLTYTGESNFFGIDTLTIVVDDQGNTGPGGARTTQVDMTISVQNVNDSPEFVSSANPEISLAEGNTLVLTHTQLLVEDIDDTSAQLIFTVVAAPTKGKLLLNNVDLAGGSFSLADVSAGRLSYASTAGKNGLDTFSIQARDSQNSTTVVRVVTLSIAINAAPTIDLNGINVENTGFNATLGSETDSISIVDKDQLTVGNDADMPGQPARLSRALVIITNAKVDEKAERLAASESSAKIKVGYTYDDANKRGELSLTGEDTIEEYRRLLRSVYYENTQDNRNLTPREIDFVVFDTQQKPSAIAKSIVAFDANLAPTIDLNGAAAGIDYTAVLSEENQIVAIVSPTLTLTNDGGGVGQPARLNRAIVRITNPKDGGNEKLEFEQAKKDPAITAEIDDHVLTFTGEATVDQYQALLRTVTYKNTAGDRDLTARVIEFQIRDTKQKSSAIARSTVTFFTNNDPPTLVLSAAPITYTEYQEDPLQLSGAQTFVYDDDEPANYNGASLAIVILDGEDSDRLTLTEGGGVNFPGSKVEYQNNVIGNFTLATNSRTLTIQFNTNAASFDAIEATIRQVGYESQLESLGEDVTAARSVRFTLDDGQAENSEVQVTRVLTLRGQNSAPRLPDPNQIIDQDYSNTFLVSDLLTNERYTEPDINGAAQRGAMVSNIKNGGYGGWFYCIPSLTATCLVEGTGWTAIMTGTGWTKVGDISDEPAGLGGLLLPMTALVRLNLDPANIDNCKEVPNIVLRAWDLTDGGTFGGRIKPKPQGGGTSAYSSNNMKFDLKNLVDIVEPPANPCN